MKIDLRFRIALAITFACMALVLVTGSILYAASEKLETFLVDQLVEETLNFLIQHHQQNPLHVAESSPSIQYFVVPVSDQGRLPFFVRGLPSGVHEIDIGQGRGERHIAIRDIDEKRYTVVYNLGTYEEREEEFKMLVAVLLLFSVFLAPVIGFLLARSLTRDLTELTGNIGMLAPNAESPDLRRPHQVHEVKVLATALDEYRARMSAMLRREQEFTANVSHELRTPLTEIRTSSDLLLTEQAWTEKTRARIGFIAKAEQAMRAHMDALLFLARDQTDASETVSLNECVWDIATPLLPMAKRKGIAFAIDVPVDVTMQLNRKAFHLVVSNLLANAIAYTDKGLIRVHLSGVSLLISDTGIGISADVLPRIFERFYRQDTRQDGLGIGLHIVRRICEQQNWAIKVRSVQDQGTTFELVLSERS